MLIKDNFFYQIIGEKTILNFNCKNLPAILVINNYHVIDQENDG
jgi:hypothetical protein